jgi:Rieske Fe-S protein
MDRDRRRFLSLLAATPLAGCSSGATGTTPVSFGDVPAGNLSALPVGTLRAVSGQPVCIGRDAKGVYAMTLTCTHEGCDIGATGTVAASGLTCGCHGSTYDANGNVTGGPAPAPLQHYAVTQDAQGNLVVHGNQAVDSAARLTV